MARKGGKPKCRLSTLPTPLGNPYDLVSSTAVIHAPEYSFVSIPSATDRPKPEFRSCPRRLLGETLTVEAISFPFPNLYPLQNAIGFQFRKSRSIVGGMYTKVTPVAQRVSWRFLLGLLCLGLVIVGGTLSVSHSHNQGNITHTDCALCVTAHAVVQPSATYLFIFIVQIFAAVYVLRSAPSSQKISPFALFTRPPPANDRLA